MGRADGPRPTPKDRAYCRAAHPERKHTPKFPTAARESANRVFLQRLPRMQDFAAVAPPQYRVAFIAAETAYPGYLTRRENLLITMWRSAEGFRFPEECFLGADELGRLAHTFGFLLDPNASNVFVRLFTGLFDRMLHQKTAYCNKPEANRHFFAFVRLQYYNSLLGRNRGNESKVELARALASLDPDLMGKISENMIKARRAFLEAAKENDVIKSGGTKSPSTHAKPQSEFEKAATALSQQMTERLVMRDTDGKGTGGGVGGGGGSGSEAKKVIDDYVAQPQAVGIEWSKPLLTRLCQSIDTWSREKFVQKQEKQAADEWTRVFGETPDFAAFKADHGHA